MHMYSTIKTFNRTCYLNEKMVNYNYISYFLGLHISKKDTSNVIFELIINWKLLKQVFYVITFPNHFVMQQVNFMQVSY